MQSLKVVMLIGQAVSLAPALVLFLFDDDKALGEESAPLTGTPQHAPVGCVCAPKSIAGRCCKATGVSRCVDPCGLDPSPTEQPAMTTRSCACLLRGSSGSPSPAPCRGSLSMLCGRHDHLIGAACDGP